MKIAIRFCDHDFDHKFYTVLRFILAQWRFDPETVESLTKEDWVMITGAEKLINKR